MSSATWIVAGVILAVCLAWMSVVLFPEDRVSLGVEVHEPIDYEIVPTRASLAELERGRSYYIQLCALCHGLDGSGNGEFSYRMVPKPSNLVGPAVTGKTDGELDFTIRHGIPGTAMQGWGDRLNTAQRRQIIQYIRYLKIQNSLR